mgnify:CR=1 FL=1
MLQIVMVYQLHHQNAPIGGRIAESNSGTLAGTSVAELCLEKHQNLVPKDYYCPQLKLGSMYETVGWLVGLSETLKDRCLDLPLLKGGNVELLLLTRSQLDLIWPHSPTPIPRPLPSVVLLLPASAKSPKKADSSEASLQFASEAVQCEQCCETHL